MKKNKAHVEKENKERWLLTYADLITLLMIFFVVMYALSNVDAQKFRAIAETLNKALGGGGGMALTNPGLNVVQPPSISATPPIAANESQQLENIVKELQDYLEKNGLSAQVTVVSEERGVVLSFMDPVLFPLGSAELTPTALPIIQRVGQILLQTSNYIRVEGHTDDLPINNARYPSNWELSSARATRVVQELIREMGFPPRRLSATGYGEYRPRAPNDSEANRQLNRRVDIVVLRSKYQGSESAPYMTAPEE